LNFWPGASDTNAAAWVTIFFVVIVVINFFGVRGYGEAEFVFAIIKVVAVIGFILLGIVLNCGGGPHEGYIGGRYWQSNSVPADYAGYQMGQAPGSIASGAFHSVRIPELLISFDLLIHLAPETLISFMYSTSRRKKSSLSIKP
jgi:yeast amino acid transporter